MCHPSTFNARYVGDMEHKTSSSRPIWATIALLVVVPLVLVLVAVLVLPLPGAHLPGADRPLVLLGVLGVWIAASVRVGVGVLAIAETA